MELLSQFVERALREADYNGQIRALLYIFSDPHKPDKKMDVKKLQFGLKIDKESTDNFK